MARAYIVIARNDLDSNLLQVLDLKPNSSQFQPAYDGQGQTGYQTFYSLDGVNTTLGALPAGPPITTPAVVTYGLAAYILDNVENAVGTVACTQAQANNAAGAIEDAVAAGTALTAAAINAILVAQVGAGTSLTAGNSTGSVEEILRILSGERYRIPAATAIEDGTPDKVAAPVGGFVTRPSVSNPASVAGTYGGVRGRSSTSPLPYIRPGEVRSGQAPVQSGLADVNFQDVRPIVDSGDLHLSALSGQLADLKSTNFTFVNPAFTYGGGATPAQTIAAANVPSTGTARAITIYDALGNVI